MTKLISDVYNRCPYRSACAPLTEAKIAQQHRLANGTLCTFIYARRTLLNFCCESCIYFSSVVECTLIRKSKQLNSRVNEAPSSPLSLGDAAPALVKRLIIINPFIASSTHTC